jgi:RNA polymerase sigma factor (sigma-70 family)
VGQEAVAVQRTRLWQGDVSSLPPAQREIVILRVALGMSTEETAVALGMTPGAVRVAQHRALIKLRLQHVGPDAAGGDRS